MNCAGNIRKQNKRENEKIKKMAAVIILILIAFIYGHIHKTHAIYDRTVENDQYIMLDGSQSQITQEFICEEDSLDGIQVKCQNLQEDPEAEIRVYLQDCENGGIVAKSVKKAEKSKRANSMNFRLIRSADAEGRRIK